MEFLRICTDILNSQTGKGKFSLKQVEPIIKKIINELSIDCDRFFDEVAIENEKHLDNARYTK